MARISKGHIFLHILAGVLIFSNAQVQNSPPRWVEQSVSVFPQGFSEDTEVGAYLGQLRCTDPENDPIDYRLTAGKAVRVFINGTVTLATKLDFEQKDTLGYDLTFTCVDVTQTGIKLHNEVEYRTEISVNDANDNRPEFEVNSKEGYSFKISEADPVGTPLTPSITTRDLDRTINAVLKTMYLICNSKNQTELNSQSESSRATCEKFNLTYVQRNEGVYVANITLIAPLDYETRPVYSSKIVAIDGPGASRSLSSTVNIQINVQDAQDVPPRFTNLGTTTTVSEGTRTGTYLDFAISARDGDTGDSRRVNITIVEDKMQAFYLAAAKPNGTSGIWSSQLIIRNPLDRENDDTMGMYRFVVMATELDSDGNPTTATATATYSVAISDVNDNAPTFSNQTYEVHVPETDGADKQTPNSTYQVTGLHVTCFDADEPSNARYNVTIVEQIYVSTGRRFNDYEVSPSVQFTGSASIFLKLTNTSILDYDVPEYRIQKVVLKAQEIGTAELFTGTTTISIFVEDINDNSPVFDRKEYTVNVSEGVNTFPYDLLKITATDKDSGNNGRIQYMLEGGTEEKFSINSSTGDLSLISAVDYETTAVYIFLVTATDQAETPRSTQVQVKVNVLDVNDQGPTFLQNVYQTSVLETNLTFQNAITIQAVDNSPGPEGITYEIVAGNTPEQAFTLNRNTGSLGLRSTLDFDKTPLLPNGTRSGQYNLTVRASDNGLPQPLYNYVQVYVQVIDVNNHAPVLSPKIYSANVNETAPPGTFVTQVMGTDADQGTFGKITYRLGTGQSDNFLVNPDTGRIFVANNRSFDYDVANSYQLLILATDGGAPQLTDTATVNVNILDNNNKDPEFPPQTELITVDESEPVDKVIRSIVAQDIDSTADLEYSIAPASWSGRDSNGNIVSFQSFDFRNFFGVKGNGEIYIKSPLSRNYVQTVEFVLVAHDKNTEVGIGRGNVTVTISITGKADTSIRFERIDTQFVNEDTLAEFRVLAYDPNRNPVSRYQMLPNSSPYFNVDDSGKITMKQLIDYESDPQPNHQHVLYIKATSPNGVDTATTSVTVSIQDVNDNAPVFQRSQYVAEVSEDAGYPTSVISIFATDADSKTFGPLSFRISGGLDADDFAIFEEEVPSGARSSRRGQVYVNKPLDYNRRSTYDLDLLVVDNANLQYSSTRLYGTAKLTINVIDENNHYPMFKESNRSVAVPETAEIDRSITTLIATDNDYGLNGNIIFSLEISPTFPNSNEALKLFAIHPQNGVVTVRGSLLGKGNTIYPMIVRASDRGSPPKSNITNLYITVLSTEDDDGNPKWFYPPNGYILYAPEQTPGYLIKDSQGNSQFFQVTARTGDTIQYYLSPVGRWADSFFINKTTGELTVVGNLDREVQETYELLVYAEDTSNPLIYRTGRQIVVKLTDKNDNNATFLNPKKYPGCKDISRPLVVNVTENVKANTTVYQLNACDADGPENNYNAVIYDLYNDRPYCESNNMASAMTVTPDGRLVTKRMIDYEQKTEYIMCVKVQSVVPGNSGRRKRSFDLSQVDETLDYVAYIQINILDQNDNGPKFKSPTAVAVVQTEPKAGSVMELDAKDLDGVGKNITVYRIESILFYPQGEENPSRLVGAFKVLGGKSAIYPAFPSYQDYAEGRFVVKVVAVDSSDNSRTDTQIVTIYVHKKGQAVKVILDLKPSDGFKYGEPLVDALDKVSSQYIFTYLQVSEHRSTGGIDPDKTDVCFLAVDSNSHDILNIRQVISLLDQSRYMDILDDSQYKQIDRGQCYPSQSSEKNVKWRDLWWVLVAIAIFIFVCCLILIILVCILYSKYKRYMESRKTYLVSQ